MQKRGLIPHHRLMSDYEVTLVNDNSEPLAKSVLDIYDHFILISKQCTFIIQDHISSR